MAPQEELALSVAESKTVRLSQNWGATARTVLRSRGSSEGTWQGIPGTGGQTCLDSDFGLGLWLIESSTEQLGEQLWAEIGQSLRLVESSSELR